MSKNVQISSELFQLLVRYHIDKDAIVARRIEVGLQEKIEAMKKRELYSKTKTAPTEEEKQAAKAEYNRLYGLPF